MKTDFFSLQSTHGTFPQPTLKIIEINPQNHSNDENASMDVSREIQLLSHQIINCRESAIV